MKESTADAGTHIMSMPPGRSDWFVISSPTAGAKVVAVTTVPAGVETAVSNKTPMPCIAKP